jgi:ABC-type amino acid transport substrate-binding protein
MMSRLLPVLCASALLTLMNSGAALAESVLDRIRGQAEIRLAYRDDAAPFSYRAGGAAEPAGYSVDLCRAVAKAVQTELKLPELKVVYVPVTVDDRFAAIADGKADLLCEATTETLARRALVDFSIPTFVSGAGLMIQPGGPGSFEELAGKKIGVLGATTTEDGLREFLKEHKLVAEIVPVRSHPEGFEHLRSGAIVAYFGDRTIMRYYLLQNNLDGKLLLADQYLSVEPYALALPHDPDFRLAVDRALSRLFRNGKVKALFAKTFGQDAQPTELVKGLYLSVGLPE